VSWTRCFDISFIFPFLLFVDVCSIGPKRSRFSQRLVPPLRYIFFPLHGFQRFFCGRFVSFTLEAPIFHSVARLGCFFFFLFSMFFFSSRSTSWNTTAGRPFSTALTFRPPSPVAQLDGCGPCRTAIRVWAFFCLQSHPLFFSRFVSTPFFLPYCRGVTFAGGFTLALTFFQKVMKASFNAPFLNAVDNQNPVLRTRIPKIIFPIWP